MENVSCIQEEEFQEKNDHGFPRLSIKKILEINNINLSEIDYVVFYEKPFLNLMEF